MRLAVRLMFCVLMPACAPAPQETGQCISVSDLCEYVIQVGDEWDNITAVLTENGIVVIDAGISPSLTAQYRSILEDSFSRNDFAYLFNTHSHPDHTAGNQVFSDATIVAHDNAVAAIRLNWQDTARVKARLARIIREYQAQLDTLPNGSVDWQEATCIKYIYESTWRDVSEGGFLATAPTLTFNDTLTLRCGEVTICCKYFGHAHSDSDILIHIPEKGLLFTGDLFGRYGRAYFTANDTADAAKRIAALDWLALQMPAIKFIVGGHGELLTRDDLAAFDQLVREKSSEADKEK